MRKEVVTYLQKELSDTEEERADFMRRVEKWRRQREARPEMDQKDTPWPKASNVSVPLVGNNTNQVYAAMKATYGSLKPFFTVESPLPQLTKHAEALTKYMGILVESKNHLNLKNVNNTVFYDVASLGTQFVRVPWLIEHKTFKRKDQSGNMEQVQIKTHDGPAVIPFRIEDCWVRIYYPDLQRAPWVSTVSHLTWTELKQREFLGIYDNVEEIKEFFKTQLDENMQEDLKRKGLDPENTKIYDIHQVNLYWDVDDDGIDEDVVIFFEPMSGTILREEFNEIGIRDIVRIPYIPFPYQVYAMGIGWMCEHLQDEVDALHNMRIDGTHLAMMQMGIVKRGSGIGPDEQMYPGKMLAVDSPREDFVPIKFPPVGSESLAAESMARQYADLFTGANNAMMGQPDVYAKSRATASGTMFLAQQSSRLFNAIRENIDTGYDEIGMLLVIQLVYNRENVNLSMLTEEEQDLIRQILSMKVEDIPLSFTFKVKTTDIDETEEAKRQALLTLIQLYSMYGQQMMQLLPVMSNPQMPPPIKEFAAKVYVGGTKLADKMLEFFDVENTKDFLPYVKDIDMMLKMMEMMKERSMANVSQIGGGQIQTDGNGGSGGQGLQPQGFNQPNGTDQRTGGQDFNEQ
jgi:hypothetical protein